MDENKLPTGLNPDVLTQQPVSPTPETPVNLASQLPGQSLMPESNPLNVVQPETAAAMPTAPFAPENPTAAPLTDSAVTQAPVTTESPSDLSPDIAKQLDALSTAPVTAQVTEQGGTTPSESVQPPAAETSLPTVEKVDMLLQNNKEETQLIDDAIAKLQEDKTKLEDTRTKLEQLKDGIIAVNELQAKVAAHAAEITPSPSLTQNPTETVATLPASPIAETQQAPVVQLPQTPSAAGADLQQAA